MATSTTNFFGNNDHSTQLVQLVLVGRIAVATKQEDIVAISTFTSSTYIASMILATPTILAPPIVATEYCVRVVVRI